MSRKPVCQRSATYRQFGRDPTEQIKIEETAQLPLPSGPGRVVVKILASTVTVQDCLIRRGLDSNLTDPVGLPAVSGRDFVGTIFLCGDNVTNFKPGDRVAGLLRSGGNAHFAEVPMHVLVPVPKRIDIAEAACMISVYTSAYQSISRAIKDSNILEMEGKRVLVVGGMDGIGLAIIQMCRKAKADVFVTAPERRHAYVRSILKATPLPENSSEWGPQTADSMDYVFDGICEGSMEPSMSALKDSGKCVCFGTSSLINETMGWFGVPLHRRFDLLKLEANSKFEYFDVRERFAREPEKFKENVKSLFDLLSKKKIKPEIAKKVGLDEVGLVHQKIEQGQIRGTVVCLPWKRISRRNVYNLDQEDVRKSSE